MPKKNNVDSFLNKARTIHDEQNPIPVVIMEQKSLPDFMDSIIRLGWTLLILFLLGVVVLTVTACISSGPDFFQQQQSNRDFMTRIGAWENPYVSPAEKRYQVREILKKGLE